MSTPPDETEVLKFTDNPTLYSMTPQPERTPGTVMAEMLRQQMAVGAHDPALEGELRQASQNFFNGRGTLVAFEDVEPTPRCDAAWKLHLEDETDAAADPWGLAAELERENYKLRQSLRDIATRVSSGQAFTEHGKPVVIRSAQHARKLLISP